jgi:addiction module HigA family antidote
MSDMHNPPHPGETLRDDVLPALGLTVTESARHLGVTRTALSARVKVVVASVMLPTIELGCRPNAP